MSLDQFLFEPPTGPVLVQPIDRQPIFRSTRPNLMASCVSGELIDSVEFITEQKLALRHEHLARSGEPGCGLFRPMRRTWVRRDPMMRSQAARPVTSEQAANLVVSVGRNLHGPREVPIRRLL